MRDIKFRAWDKKRQEMFYDFDQNIKYLKVGNSIHEFVWSVGIQYKTLMQYTGLKDKNGKEIYEGDVVNFWANPKNYGGYKGHNYKSIVKWNSIDYCFDFKSGHRLNDFDNLKVIGNIHQNPEAMK